MLKRSIFALLAGVALSALPATAATYYVAPIGTTISGTPDGSKDRPFASTDAALASGKLMGGDTVLLMDGAHPVLKIGVPFSSDITFKSENGRKARVEGISITSTAKNIIVSDLKVWTDKPVSNFTAIVSSATTTSDIDFVRLDVRGGGERAYDYLTWSETDWKVKAPSGVFVSGPRSVVRNSNVTAVYFGIVLGGQDTAAYSNRIEGFAADGLRGFGPNNTFRDNVVTDCFSIDGNHADGFQAFSSTSIIGITLERNQIIEWTHAPDHPLRCWLQGIGLFEGLYENFRIVNNVVATSMGHGITVFGGKNVEIINNTVVNIRGEHPGWPWIGIFDSKTGRKSVDVLVANNLAMGYMGATDMENRIYFRNNRIIRAIPWAFPGWEDQNYVPREDARFLGKAELKYTPELDVMRNVRPMDGLRDIGAHEVGELSGTGDPSDDAPPAISAERDQAEATAESTSSSSGSTGAKFISAP